MVSDGFLDELEWQFAAEREQEQNLLDVEAERLRIAKLTLVDRAMALWEAATRIQISTGALMHRGVLQQAGADWLGIAAEPNLDELTVIQLSAVREIRSGEAGIAEMVTPVSAMQRRMTFGYLCRDLARRRVPLQLALQDAEWINAAIVRAGADHCDLRLEGSGLTAHTHIVAFSAIAAVRFSVNL